MADIYVWLLSFFFIIALLILVVFQLMCLADLEFDYINPYDSSSRINKVVVPEFITQGVLALDYVILLCALPLLQFKIVHSAKAPGGCYRDIQSVTLGKEAKAFQTRLSYFSSLSLHILVDLQCVGGS
ncbi:Protein cornichon-like 4, partial [Cucurbita argyrosperma subsp. argyrosperma]